MRVTPEQWHRVKEVFEGALEQAPEERFAFVGQACAGDDLLRSEVNSLLSSYEQETSFMETPAAAIAAQSLAKEESAALVGQQLGHYQIIREIGRGGMGVVYLAQDISLGRSVALKLLPTHLTSDPDRLRRFEREARAASALNHPNILTIYEIAQMDGLHFIATEFIDGVTLRQQIKSKELKLSEALIITEQMASALAAAHEAGIVHRDIKPENVMLRRDGYVKVLDFGLAKLAERSAVKVAAASAAIVGATDTGVMGTVGYMSPEQAQGLSVDERTDIFSLGVVIYEMVTGQMPFAVKAHGDVAVPILEEEPPPLTDYVPQAPAGLQLIVSKALRRNREERYQAIAELLVDLKSVSSGPIKKSGFSGRRLTLLAAATLALMLGGAMWLRFSRPAADTESKPPSPAPHAAMRTVPFTGLPGTEHTPAFSPDGNQVAFMWSGEAGDNWDIYVKDVDSGTQRRLTTNPDKDVVPVWSPDGQYIAFTRFSAEYKERAIFMIPAIGGPERKLLTAHVAPFPGWGGRIDWSPDGKSIAYSDATGPSRPFALYRLTVETLETQKLTTTPDTLSGDTQPVFSPDGEMLAFVRAPFEMLDDIYLMPAAGGEATRLTFDKRMIRGLAWMPDGRSIVFASQHGATMNLRRISFAGGEPEALGVGGDKAFAPAISRQGQRLAYQSVSSGTTSIWRIDLAASPGKASSRIRVLSATSWNGDPQISPDGKRMVFASERSGDREIWVCDSDGSNPLQLTKLYALSDGPNWSPDGRSIAFGSWRREENVDIHVIGANGGVPRRLTEDPSLDVNPSWSRDGRWIYFVSNRSGDQQVWKMPAEGGEAVQVTRQGGDRAIESSDGKYVYFAKGYHVSGLWRVPVEGGEEELVLDRLHAEYFQEWAVADKGIYFVEPEGKSGAVIEFYSLSTRRVTRVAAMQKVPVLSSLLNVTRDGRWLLYTQSDVVESADIMLVENFR